MLRSYTKERDTLQNVPQEYVKVNIVGEVRGTLLQGGVGGIDLLEGPHTLYESEDVKTVIYSMLGQGREISSFLVDLEVNYLEKQFSGFDSKQASFLLIKIRTTA